MKTFKKVLASSVLATSFAIYTVGSVHAEVSVSNTAIKANQSSVNDTKAPVIPKVYVQKSINKFNQKKFEVKGVAEPKSKVVGQLKSMDSQITFEAKTDEKGNFKSFLNTQKLKDGALKLSVYNVDASGNKGKLKNVSILKDTFLEELTVENEGFINSYNVSDFPVSGTGDPKATVYITLQSGKQIVMGKTIVDEFGNYSLNMNVQKFAEGKVAIQAKQVDKAGNTENVAVNVTKETKSPNKPVIFKPSNITANTDQTTYKIKGLGKAGSEIEIVLSDGIIDVSSIGEVDANGSFEVEIETTDLQSGEIKVTAIQTSTAGNTSLESVTKFMKDTDGPNTPELNALVSIKQENVANYTVSGKGEIGSIIKIFVTDGKTTVTNSAIVTEQGTFTTNLNLTTLQSGNVYFIATQLDSSNNSSTPVTVTILKS